MTPSVWVVVPAQSTGDVFPAGLAPGASEHTEDQQVCDEGRRRHKPRGVATLSVPGFSALQTVEERDQIVLLL